jgi:hypothetical protein
MEDCEDIADEWDQPDFSDGIRCVDKDGGYANLRSRRRERAKRKADAEAKAEADALAVRKATREREACSRAMAVEALVDEGDASIAQAWASRTPEAVAAVEARFGHCFDERVAECQAFVDREGLKGAMECWQKRPWTESKVEGASPEWPQEVLGCLETAENRSAELAHCAELPETNVEDREYKLECLREAPAPALACGPLNLAEYVSKQDAQLGLTGLRTRLSAEIEPIRCARHLAEAKEARLTARYADASESLRLADASCSGPKERKALEAESRQLEKDSARAQVQERKNREAEERRRRKVEAEIARCGGTSAYQLLLQMKWRGFDEKSALGCRYDVGLGKVLLKTNDGLYNVQLAAAGLIMLRSKKPLLADSYIRGTVQFVGLHDFELVGGGVATLAVFVLVSAE